VPFLNATQAETETVLLLLCLPVLDRNLVERNMLTYIYTDIMTVANVGQCEGHNKIYKIGAGKQTNNLRWGKKRRKIQISNGQQRYNEKKTP